MFQLSRSRGPRSRLWIEHGMTTRSVEIQVRRNGQKFTHEEVVCFWTETSYLKQLYQIEKLPVNIAAYLNRERE
jgi:hypothetical protein